MSTCVPDMPRYTRGCTDRVIERCSPPSSTYSPAGVPSGIHHLRSGQRADRTCRVDAGARVERSTSRTDTSCTGSEVRHRSRSHVTEAQFGASDSGRPALPRVRPGALLSGHRCYTDECNEQHPRGGSSSEDERSRTDRTQQTYSDSEAQPEHRRGQQSRLNERGLTDDDIG